MRDFFREEPALTVAQLSLALKMLPFAPYNTTQKEDLRADLLALLGAREQTPGASHAWPSQGSPREEFAHEVVAGVFDLAFAIERDRTRKPWRREYRNVYTDNGDVWYHTQIVEVWSGQWFGYHCRAVLSEYHGMENVRHDCMGTVHTPGKTHNYSTAVSDKYATFGAFKWRVFLDLRQRAQDIEHYRQHT